eukprot:scaffold50433_cov38-Tisochrysis_lutea.AAC.2
MDTLHHGPCFHRPGSLETSDTSPRIGTSFRKHGHLARAHWLDPFYTSQQPNSNPSSSPHLSQKYDIYVTMGEGVFSVHGSLTHLCDNGRRSVLRAWLPHVGAAESPKSQERTEWARGGTPHR